MGYSIFEETMADLTWLDIEKAAKENAIVLFPMGVIEEHGPHLCLGTDIYISYAGCKEIKSKLEAMGKKVLIAPPYYWGINKATGAFPGSFTVRKETMKNMLYDTMNCLHNWGFKDVFCFYGHGDIEHINTIMDAIIEVRKDTGLNTRMVVEGFSLARFGLSGKEEHILTVAPPTQEPFSNGTSQTFDIHAGAFETADMLSYYPDLVKIDVAENLQPANLTLEQLRVWGKGGEETRNLVPLGYAGSPADYRKQETAKEFYYFISKFTAQCIIDSLEQE